MQLDIVKDTARTEVGSYFVANYPPFSVWNAQELPAVWEALRAPAGAAASQVASGGALAGTDSPQGDLPQGRGAPLGLYLHIPFCRKRCKFCYFRVYTDKNAADVESYCEALAHEVALYARQPALAGRHFEFVYFGGGTPSFLSSAQLERLIGRIAEHWSWERAREVTFECEPGTLQKHKLETIRAIGVTRLSLGIEHFDDEVLEVNGRAHKSPEIFRAYAWAQDVGFKQINIDLIAGMVADTNDRWQRTVDQALELQPDSVTIYQMEVPHNTVIAREAHHAGQPAPVPDWSTKRAWVDHAFKVFEAAGYRVSSAYTLVRSGGAQDSAFVYRDAVWRGADMIGTGVASFSHLSGVHYQNVDRWEDYLARLTAGELPLGRALVTTPEQRLIREMVLQMKLGRLDAGYFRRKFGVEITQHFAEPFRRLVDDGHAQIEGDQVNLTRRGLLRVDALLVHFFEPRFREIRYT